MRIILNETKTQEKYTLPNTGKWPVTYSCAQPFHSVSVLNYFSHHICTADLSSKECFCTRLNRKMRGQGMFFGIFVLNRVSNLSIFVLNRISFLGGSTAKFLQALMLINIDFF